MACRVDKRATMPKNSHSRGSIKKQPADQTTFSGKHPALILRLRESELDCASMVFFGIFALM
jgi:hypothetical protein